MAEDSSCSQKTAATVSATDHHEDDENPSTSAAAAPPQEAGTPPAAAAPQAPPPRINRENEEMPPGFDAKDSIRPAATAAATAAASRRQQRQETPVVSAVPVVAQHVDDVSPLTVAAQRGESNRTNSDQPTTTSTTPAPVLHDTGDTKSTPPVTSTSSWSWLVPESKAGQWVCRLSILVVILAIIAVAGVCGSGNCQASTSESSPTPTAPPTVTRLPTLAPIQPYSLTPTVSEFTTGLCFESTLELEDAVNTYITDSSPDGIVSQTYGWPINEWCVSQISDFSRLFFGLTTFNDSLDKWNMSSATSTRSMFYGASSFNQNLSNWNLSSVTDFESMFYGCTAFNGSVDQWDTSQVTSMRLLFSGATSFDRDIAPWNVSRVESFTWMLKGATSFNQSLCEWGNEVQEDALVSSMFADTACEDTSDPDLDASDPGPFCVPCSVESPAPSSAGTIGISTRFPSQPPQTVPASSPGQVSRRPTRPTVAAPSTSEPPVAATGPPRDGQTFAPTSFESSAQTGPSPNFTATEPVPAPGYYFYFVPTGPYYSTSGPLDDDLYAAVPPPSPYLCFESTPELLDAVDAYLLDNQDALIAETYGPTMNDWCVSNILDFSSVFSVERNPLVVTFNESVADWSVMSATDMSNMFFGATSFRQDLCDWGLWLANDVNVEDMFLNSGCPEQGSPDLTAGVPGPFCVPC